MIVPRSCFSCCHSRRMMESDRIKYSDMFISCELHEAQLETHAMLCEDYEEIDGILKICPKCKKKFECTCFHKYCNSCYDVEYPGNVGGRIKLEKMAISEMTDEERKVEEERYKAWKKGRENSEKIILEGFLRQNEEIDSIFGMDGAYKLVNSNEIQTLRYLKDLAVLSAKRTQFYQIMGPLVLILGIAFYSVFPQFAWAMFIMFVFLFFGWWHQRREEALHSKRETHYSGWLHVEILNRKAASESS